MSVFNPSDVGGIGAVTVLVVAVDGVEFLKLGNVVAVIGVQVSVLSSVDIAVTSSVVALVTAVNIIEFMRLVVVLGSMLASAEVLRLLAGVSVVTAGIEFEFTFVNEVQRVDTGTRTGFEADVEFIALSITVTVRRITELMNLFMINMKHIIINMKHVYRR